MSRNPRPGTLNGDSIEGMWTENNKEDISFIYKEGGNIYFKVIFLDGKEFKTELKREFRYGTFGYINDFGSVYSIEHNSGDLVISDEEGVVKRLFAIK